MFWKYSERIYRICLNSKVNVLQNNNQLSIYNVFPFNRNYKVIVLSLVWYAVYFSIRYGLAILLLLIHHNGFLGVRR
jgi:hypothetical protein